MDKPTESRSTTRGTPCAKSWNDAWVQRVEETEERLGCRVCGAHTPAGTPCAVASNHPSGRCRFHGGFDLTGAPEGNRNAVLHGLYARRLQTCGIHCPRWNSCPCAGQDVLDLPAAERPVCPYEQTEFNTFYTDARAQFGQSPLARHDARHLALLHVMLGRAAAALAEQPMTETAHSETDAQRGGPSRVSAAFQAYTRLAAEYRALRKQLFDTYPTQLPDAWDAPSGDEVARRLSRAKADTRLDPDAVEKIVQDAPLLDENLDNLLCAAFRHAVHGEDAPLIELLHRLYNLAPDYTLECWYTLLDTFRLPKGSPGAPAINRAYEHCAKLLKKAKAKAKAAAKAAAGAAATAKGGAEGGQEKAKDGKNGSAGKNGEDESVVTDEALRAWLAERLPQETAGVEA